MNRRQMEQEPIPHFEVFDVTPDHASARRLLPSETRDFAPTRTGWAGIISGTVVLGWLFWAFRGNDAGVGWLVISVVLGYFVATIAWTAIRRELDRRDDLAHGQEGGSHESPCRVEQHGSPHPS